jgi:lysophospholipase L1-like esterase
LPPVDGRRLVILGDSCSFGWGINTPDTFFAKLDGLQRDAGAGFEVLNAAFPGQSAVAGEYMLRDLVLPLHPEFVVLGFTGNNAFRFSLVRDADRFRFATARRLLLHSRLFEILAIKLAQRAGPTANPRDRKGIAAQPFTVLERVAAPDYFVYALRNMVRDARASGTTPIFLIFPRSSIVSSQFGNQDAAVMRQFGRNPPGSDRAATPREIGMLELSCIEPGRLADPLAELRRRLVDWRPTLPNDPEQRAVLRTGAEAYVRGDFAAAEEAFGRAVAKQPDVPLATYDLGVTQLRLGRSDGGLKELERASHLACSIFLEFQVVLWRVANQLDVPVVDLTFHFQAHDGEKLYLDPAHPNLAGQDIIAQALWDELRTRLTPDPGRKTALTRVENAG